MPLFFVGSLEAAINEALLLPAKDMKLLSIYLHSDNYDLANQFCTKILCNQDVLNCLASYFIVWPCDITLNEQEKHFYEKCMQCFGRALVRRLKDINYTFPLFMIVNRTNSNNKVISIIQGSSTANDMISSLMEMYRRIQAQRERDEREQLKKEQDEAYNLSLATDKAKQEKKLKEEALINLLLLERDTKRKQCHSKLPNEPSDSTPAHLVSSIKFIMKIRNK